MEEKQAPIHRPENQVVWEQKSKEADRITDRLGKGLDTGIKETVVGLHVFGIHTTQSCEGHLDWGVCSPWVEVAAPVSQELQQLEEQRQQAQRDAEAQVKGGVLGEKANEL